MMPDFFPVAGQVNPLQVAQAAEAGSAALERGGLYTVVAALVILICWLLWDKEKKQVKLETTMEEYQRKLLSIVERQTEVMVKQHIVAEKVETVLVRVISVLDTPRRD